MVKTKLKLLKQEDIIMPLYEYRCTYCDHLFEKLQTHFEDNPVCPICGSETVRIMSSPSIRFRGSGFHCTDYTKHGHIKKSGKGIV